MRSVMREFTCELTETITSRFKDITDQRDRCSSGFHNSKSGGGVLIAVSKRLKSVRCIQYENFYINGLTCDYDIIVLCETWLAGDILDSELFSDRYSVYRRDRCSSGFHNSKSGGGVLIAVSKRLKSVRCIQYESKCEDVWFKNPLDDTSFRILKTRCNQLAQSSYNSYIESIETSLTSNPRLFWSFLKQKRKGCSSYPSAMTYKDKIAHTGSEICNAFASCFSSVYDCDFNSANMNATCSLVYDASGSQTLHDVTITTGMVEKALKALDPRKGAGPDGLPSSFVASCHEVLAEPLSLIYNKSLRTGIFPSIWKEALIVPVYKSGDKTSVNNYRPISLLSIFGKVFEVLVHPFLAWHFKNILLPQQHGFIRSRSTVKNLAGFVSDLVAAVDHGTPVDVIYTDFSRAFDKVDHKTLVSKLFRYGIFGNLLNWCESYLTERSSRVVLNGFISSSFLIASGVPQGSHLGPLFFNAFINDVASCFLNSKIHLYADDLKIVRLINNVNDPILLQEDLNRFSSWCKVNSMKLNVSKCSYRHFSRRKSPYFNTYKINNDIIGEVDVIRDLGVFMDQKLRFHIHIDKITIKSFKLLGFVLRNCKEFRQASSKIAVFNTLVRSGLEYCSVIWTPYYEVHKQLLVYGFLLYLDSAGMGVESKDFVVETGYSVKNFLKCCSNFSI
ncbi:hypothetical protein evm_004864 [Chilo suppressalis]|nr:hypothetical protein evm_004864 [Chilo suppressalis]